MALTVGNLMLVRILATSGFALTGMFGPGQMPFWIITAVVSVVIGAAIGVPHLAKLFHFQAPGIATLLGVIGGSVLAMLLLDLIKRLPLVQRTLMVASKAIAPV